MAAGEGNPGNQGEVKELSWPGKVSEKLAI